MNRMTLPMINVADVDLGHVVVAAEHLSYRVQALHFEVLVPEIWVDRGEIDATSHLVCSFLRDWKE